MHFEGVLWCVDIYISLSPYLYPICVSYVNWFTAHIYTDLCQSIEREPASRNVLGVHARPAGTPNFSHPRVSEGLFSKLLNDTCLRCL